MVEAPRRRDAAAQMDGGSAEDPARAERMASLEAAQKLCSNDPEPWLLHALEHIDFNSEQLTNGRSPVHGPCQDSTIVILLSQDPTMDPTMVPRCRSIWHGNMPVCHEGPAAATSTALHTVEGHHCIHTQAW